MLLDKTGTITLGHPELADVASLDGLPEDETLRLAASLDRLSAHPLAAALVAGAEQRGLELSLPESAEETLGHGIEGSRRRTPRARRQRPLAPGARPRLPRSRPLDGGAATVYVAIDGAPAAVILLDDRLREDAALLVPRLREAGIEHTALVTGDKPAVAERVAAELGIERVYAEQTPEQKLEIVRALQAQPNLRNVVMVGDGINDAPALALADVGIAMGTIGATVSSETADAVILVDRVDRVADAVRIGRRALAIARQSVLLGLGASLVAMGFAAAGFLTAGDGRLAAGSDRRRRHPQRPPRPPRLTAISSFDDPQRGGEVHVPEPADAEQRSECNCDDPERRCDGDRCGGERDGQSELGVGVAGDDVDDPAEQRDSEPEPDEGSEYPDQHALDDRFAKDAPDRNPVRKPPHRSEPRYPPVPETCPQDSSAQQRDPECALFQGLSVPQRTATPSTPSIPRRCSDVPDDRPICRPFAAGGALARLVSPLEGGSLRCWFRQQH